MFKYKSNLISKFVVGAALSLASVMSHAAVLSADTKVDFTYTGTNQLDMVGSFTYNSKSIGSDNIVNANELLSFTFTVTKRLEPSIFVTNDSGSLSTFVFSFNAESKKFVYSNGANAWIDNSNSLYLISRVGSQLSLRSINDNTPINKVDSAFTYTVTAVPEPETYSMLLVGLGLIGAAACRRKQAI